MKIILNTFRENILNEFTKLGKLNKIDVICVKTERELLAVISKDNRVDGFILNNQFDYTQKAVDFIRKKVPHVPIIVYTPTYNKIKDADIQMFDGTKIVSQTMMDNDEIKSIRFLFDITIENIKKFNSTFKRLQKITATPSKPIIFGKCIYDPMRRTLDHDGTFIKRLTAKEGGIIELLSANLGQVVKKDIILEKVWHKTDYFSGRSMDVYVTNLRKLLQKHKIDLTIKNISGSGLILE